MWLVIHADVKVNPCLWKDRSSQEISRLFRVLAPIEPIFHDLECYNLAVTLIRRSFIQTEDKHTSDPLHQDLKVWNWSINAPFHAKPRASPERYPIIMYTCRRQISRVVFTSNRCQRSRTFSATARQCRVNYRWLTTNDANKVIYMVMRIFRSIALHSGWKGVKMPLRRLDDTPLYKPMLTQWWHHGPLTTYVKLRVAHAPGMPGTFSPLPTSKEAAS